MNRQTRLAALVRLDRALADPESSIRDAARKHLIAADRGLVKLGLGNEFLTRIALLSPHLSEAERHETWGALRNLARHGADRLPADLADALRELSDRLLGDSFHDRLRRYTGKLSWREWAESAISQEARPEQPVEKLAEEAFDQPDLLRPELPWLFSGEGVHMIPFGRRLGELDAQHRFLGELVAAAQGSPDPRVLSGYLVARADRGEQGWVDQLLDEWAQNTERAFLAFDTTARAPATQGAVGRLRTMVTAGGLDVALLNQLVVGAWVSGLSEESLRVLLVLLLNDERAVVAEGAMAILDQWIDSHRTPLPPELEEAARELLGRPLGSLAGPMGAFYWARLARVILKHDAVYVARAVLKAVREEDPPAHDERLAVLAEALRADTTGVWPEIGALMLADSGAALTLGWWAQEAAPLEIVDPSPMLTWAAEGEGEERAVLLAHLLKPCEPLAPIIRALLARYGGLGRVGAALAANFYSGSWWGSHADRERERRKTATGWLTDAEPEVQIWAAENIASIDRALPALELREIEEDRL